MESSEEHPAMVAFLGVTQEENIRISACVAQDYQDVPNVSCDCDPHLVASALEAKVHKSKYAMAVGATVPYRPDHLIDDEALKFPISARSVLCRRWYVSELTTCVTLQ